jgi:hypothetical protein
MISAATFCTRAITSSVRLKNSAAEHAAPLGVGHLQVLEHREVFVDRRVLELAPDAGAHDLELAHPTSVRGS